MPVGAEYEDSEMLSARQYLGLVAEARTRQIDQVRARALDASKEVEQARARFIEAEAAVLFAKREYDLACARREAVEQQLVLAERPLEEDPAVRRHLQTIHPLRRVPHNILAIIFIYAAESSEDMSVKRIQRLPYRLALVSRRWREAALKTPAMWRFIAIRMDKVNTAREYDLQAFYLETSLARAGDFALDVTVEYLGDKAPSNKTYATKLVGDIYKLLESPVSKLDLYLQHGVNDMKTILDFKADKVEELALLSSSPLQFEPLFPADARNLKTVRACLGHFSDPLASVYQQVSSVAIESVLPGGSAATRISPRNNALVNVFAAFPNAEKMELHVGREGQCELLQNDALTELSIVSLGGFEPLSLIYKFPQLRTASFDIAATSARATNFLGLRHLMTAGALASVHTLELAARMPLDAKLMGAMRGMQELREATFIGGRPDAGFFRLLGSPDDDEPYPCRNLAVLSFLRGEEDGDAFTEPFCAEELLACIGARTVAHNGGWISARFEQVTVDWKDVPADFASRLEPLLN